MSVAAPTHADSTLAALTLKEFLAFNNETFLRWQQWLEKHPEALDLPCAIMNTGSVRFLLQHILAVELRYAQRLTENSISDYGEVQTHSVAALFETHQRATALLASFIESTDARALEHQIEMALRSGAKITASRRKIFVHVLLHSQRHWAQLASLLRERGLPADFGGDFLFSAVMD